MARTKRRSNRPRRRYHLREDHDVGGRQMFSQLSPSYQRSIKRLLAELLKKHPNLTHNSPEAKKFAQANGLDDRSMDNLMREVRGAYHEGRRVLGAIRCEFVGECRELFHNSNGWDAFESYVGNAYGIASRQDLQALEFNDSKRFKEYDDILSLAKKLTEGGTPDEVAEAIQKKNEDLIAFELKPLLARLQTRNINESESESQAYPLGDDMMRGWADSEEDESKLYTAQEIQQMVGMGDVRTNDHGVLIVGDGDGFAALIDGEWHGFQGEAGASPEMSSEELMGFWEY